MNSELEILTYLNSFDEDMIIFGVKAKDIILLINESDKTHKWSNDYWLMVEDVFNKLTNTQLNNLT